jgi:hypothetical protein
LCWNLSGRGKELKSSSWSAILATWIFGGVFGFLPRFATSFVSLRNGNGMQYSIATTSSHWQLEDRSTRDTFMMFKWQEQRASYLVMLA